MTDDHAATSDLDGPIAAPDHHRVVFENDRVRVIETVIRAGDTARLHTHLLPSLSVITSGSQLVRRDHAGTILLDTRSADPMPVMPRYVWSDGIPAHSLENAGSDDIVAIAIELKPA